MKFLVSLLLTLLLSFIAGMYIEYWWSFVVVAFAVALLIPQKPWKAFASGFLSLFLLWGGLAYWIDFKNEGILSSKIASLFPLGGSSVALIFCTAIVGGIVAGFSALSGAYARKVS